MIVADAEYLGPLSTIGPARECACVVMMTDWVITHLTYTMMEKAYGRRVTRDAGVPWARCPHCHGSGIDRRP